jgi:RNA polymerase sigma-70 factor, ECF subfamily
VCDKLVSRMKEELRSSVNDLARACSRSADAAEWEEFVRRCTPLASLVALRVSRLWLSGPSPTAVDDIVQEVFLKLCEQERRVLADFEPREEDSFLGLLSMVAASVANDYFRRIYSAKRGGKVVINPLGDDEFQISAASAHPAAQMQRSALLAQLDEKLRSAPESVGERDRAFFWLYYRQGFTAEEIAGLPGVGLTAKGVESALRRIAVWLRGEMKSRKAAETAESA